MVAIINNPINIRITADSHLKVRSNDNRLGFIIHRRIAAQISIARNTPDSRSMYVEKILTPVSVSNVVDRGWVGVFFSIELDIGFQIVSTYMKTT